MGIRLQGSAVRENYQPLWAKANEMTRHMRPDLDYLQALIYAFALLEIEEKIS